MADARSGRWSKAARASARPTMRARAPGRQPAASARSARSTPTATTPKAGSSRKSTARSRAGAPRGAGPICDRRRRRAGPARTRHRRRQGRDQHQRAVGNGRRPGVLHGVLERTKGLVTGVTCGAGMPYKLSEIAASYGVNYLPINCPAGKGVQELNNLQLMETRGWDEQSSAPAARYQHVLTASKIWRRRQGARTKSGVAWQDHHVLLAVVGAGHAGRAGGIAGLQGVAGPTVLSAVPVGLQPTRRARSGRAADKSSG